MPARTILVTGATRGIGRAIVEELISHDHPVAFTYRSDEAGARDLERSAAGRAVAFAFDHREAEAADRLVEAVERRLGPIVGLVNNAGLRKDGLLALMSDDDWNEVLDVNLGGTFRLCRSVMRGMIGNRRGSIVNLSSLSAHHGVAGQGAYAAAKAGILGMTRALAREVGRKNIRVNAVAPGFVSTEMTADLPAERQSALRSHECLSGGVLPVHVAATVRFLLSDEAAGITGQCFSVDAGASA